MFYNMPFAVVNAIRSLEGQMSINELERKVRELEREISQLKYERERDKHMQQAGEKSAFQEFQEKTSVTYVFQMEGAVDYGKQQEIDRKRGWNAAIDAVLNLPAGLDRLVDRIQELKEP
jgi:uncharacterized small protein (DUF1192 family)